MIDYQTIWREVTSRFQEELSAIHGPEHWHRVEDVGLKIAHLTGKVDRDVVRLFAVFHDSCRQNDHHDPEHGYRGADYAKEARGRLYELDDDRFNLLYKACSRHADGFTCGEPTIAACFDADRLDLRRLGIEPDPSLISTPEVRISLQPHTRR